METGKSEWQLLRGKWDERESGEDLMDGVSPVEQHAVNFPISVNNVQLFR